jgi:hypothetical protein
MSPAAANPAPIGGIAGRHWLGEPGRSGLVSGRMTLYQVVADQDREQVEGELKARLTQEIRRGIHTQTGLLVGRPRIEWLVLWDGGTESLTRLNAFCEGWSASMPPGVRIRSLTSKVVQDLAHQVWGSRRPRGGPGEARKATQSVPEPPGTG